MANFFRLSKKDTVCRADVVCTRRQKSLIHPVMTEVAFLGDTLIRVKGYGIVRAGLYTQFTSGTLIIVHDNNTVFPFGNGLFRACINTGGIVAVPAYIHLKNKIQLSVNHVWTVF